MALTDKVCVIVGATGHLGQPVARAFTSAGCRLALVGMREDELNALQTFAGFRKSRVTLYPGEATDAVAMQGVAERVRNDFGRADILLHLTGGFQGGKLGETSDAMWDTMLAQNLRTAVNSIRAFLPMLIENGWGRIVTVSSGITQTPPASAVAYVTAKAALETMTLAVAQEVKDFGVTANVILIRSLDTPAERARQPEKVGGWVTAEDVAGTMLFLCSPEAGAINGARIPIYGGAG